MRKFQFRLASLLRLRTAQLQAARATLAHELAQVAAIGRDIEALAAERAAAVSFVQKETRTTGPELRALAAYLLGYEARLAAFSQALEEANLRVAARRSELMEADRAERLLLKLQDKRYAEWRIEADRELEILAQESWNSVHAKD